VSNPLTVGTEHVNLAARGRAYVEGCVPPPPIARLIGFRPLSLYPGRAVFELDTDLQQHANPMGTVHGGILCDLADAAMGFAYASTLEETSSVGSGRLACLPPPASFSADARSDWSSAM
jgi:acyl-coenzyme A thioesterase PaaI-like protein